MDLLVAVDGWPVITTVYKGHVRLLPGVGQN